MLERHLAGRMVIALPEDEFLLPRFNSIKW